MGRPKNSTLSGAAVVGFTVVAAMIALHRRKQKEGFRWLARVDVSRVAVDQAAVFELHDLDRSPSGRVGGTGALSCSDTGSNVPVEALCDVPGLLLYSIEMIGGKIMLVFMQVPNVPEVFNAPFLDRGVRALAEIGSRVYVTRLESVEGLPGFLPVDKLPPREQSRYSIVWNTGRCGSTLMHKMMQKIGVLSFSEPYWLDKITRFSIQGIDGDTIARVFGVCAAVEVMLARKSFPAYPKAPGSPSTLGSAHASFNPKGIGFMAMEPIMKSLPHAKHMLMYRDVREVAESFCSIAVFRLEPSLLNKVLGILPFWGKVQPALLPPPLSKDGPTFSKGVRQAIESGDIVGPSHPMVCRISTFWMQTLCLWKELRELGFPKGGRAVALRMADFTRQDPKVIKTILRLVLGDDVDVGDDAIEVALEAFKRHSQAGDPMARSSNSSGDGKKAPFLTPEDLREIEELVAAVPALGSPEFVFPDSLGAPASAFC